MALLLLVNEKIETERFAKSFKTEVGGLTCKSCEFVLPPHIDLTDATKDSER